MCSHWEQNKLRLSPLYSSWGTIIGLAGDCPGNKALEDLAQRNKARILMSTDISDNQRSQLIAAQMVVERIGSGPLEEALRLVFEEGLMFYLANEFDRLNAMGMAGYDWKGRSGKA